MRNKDIEDIATGWVIGDMIDEATSGDHSNNSGFGAVMFWGFIAFILFVLSAVLDISWSAWLSFLKIITFPVTWDYQLLDFKFFGVNNYYSFVYSLGLFWLMANYGKTLDKFFIDFLEKKLLNTRIGHFQPVRTAAVVTTSLYETVFSFLIMFYIFVTILKIMAHGFLSILTFIFSL